jgi:signal transduction histidine kinase
MASMTLHEVLAGKRDEVILRWKAQVQGTLAPESMPPIELVDYLPKFLGEIITALREDAGLTSLGPSPEESTTAAGHGEQRLRLGFSLDAVVREYGALHNAIVATARDAAAQISFRDLQVIFNSIITGIAQAVSEYAHQRDAELLRQTNEHFAFIAHELRNPLSSATMAFQLLKNKGKIPLDGRSAHALERGLQQMSELVDHTLQTARIASGVELRRQWTTLRTLFEEAEIGAVSEAEGKGVGLRLVIENEERVDLDLRLIRSALGNLVRNGVKYTPSGGVVELRGGVSNGRLIIEIEDNCGGLPPGMVEEAFAPFVRLDSSGQSGFGLGLAIAKQAVDAHGGSIRVQNVPGKGCIFVLELPIAVESAR